MPRGLILAALFVSSACADTVLWPEHLGPYSRHYHEMTGGRMIVPSPLEREYGQEDYDLNVDYGLFRASTERYKDVTGAYAAWLDPANKGATRVGNYLIWCSGQCPKNLAELADAGLPHVSHGSLPTLGTYFPAKNLLPNSERYILGPVGLAANAPEIPAQDALFDFGTEAELARYRTPGGPANLLVFSFATPSLARQQLPQFQKIANAAVKRTGPLVVVALGASSANPQLLNAIDYQAVVAMNEKPPEKPLELKPESAGKMVLSIFSLAGLLLVFCLLSGLAVGGVLRLARKFGYSAAEGSMTTLHLEGK
jgi:hypothetical protein